MDEKIVMENEEIVTDINLETNDNTNEQKNKKKKKKIGRIIFNIFSFLLFVVIIFDVVIGVVNMQRISNKEEPVWYLTMKTTETDKKTVTEYHLGLYKIVKTDTAKETKTTLKPFFLGE